MSNLRHGDRVHVWPTHARVQNGATAFERWMPMVGRVVTIDRWWMSRLADGDVVLVEPKQPATADSTKPAAVVVPVSTERKRGDF